MGPVNNILNRIDSWDNQDTSALKREFGSRFTNLFVTAPLELTAVAQNGLIALVQAPCALLKTGAKAITYISSSEAVKNFEAKLPGFTDLLKSIVRAVAYVFGAALSATLGVISPATNFNWHCAIGMATNRKEKEVKAALDEKLADEKKLQDEAAQQQHTENGDAQHTFKEAVVADLAEVYAEAEKVTEELKVEAQAIYADPKKEAEKIAEELKADAETLIDDVKNFAQPEPSPLDKKIQEEVDVLAHSLSDVKEEIEETVVHVEQDVKEAFEKTADHVEQDVKAAVVTTEEDVEELKEDVTPVAADPVAAKTEVSDIEDSDEEYEYSTEIEDIPGPFAGLQDRGEAVLKGTYNAVRHPGETYNKVINFFSTPSKTQET